MTVPDPAPRVLFVCLGNICRSPTAEAVLRCLAPDLEIDSAGTGAWHVGNPPHAGAVRAGAARGYDLSPLRARQLAAADFHAFDRIVAMDSQNLADIAARKPAGASARLSRLMDHVQDAPRAEVPDPYFTGDFDGVLDLIEAGCRGLVRDIGR